jgi:hypothetical protein
MFYMEIRKALKAILAYSSCVSEEKKIICLP